MSDGSDLDIFACAVAQAHDACRRAAADERLGHHEQIDIEVGVELERDVAGQLDMLLLVLADGDMRRLVEQDVGGLEHRVGVRGRRRRLRGFSLPCPSTASSG